MTNRTIYETNINKHDKQNDIHDNKHAKHKNKYHKQIKHGMTSNNKL